MKKNFCSLSHIQLAFGFTLLASGVAIGQMRVITGTVTDNTNNKPISGVSIFQEGKDTVATTNSSGIYRIQVSGENPVLVFKHPDYPERKVSLGDRVSVDVSLGNENENGIGSGNEIGNERKNESEKAIEEVVLNAGYYKVRDKERTGSISRVSAKDIENQPVTNVLASAQGRMSGVSITQNSGTPGGGFDIQIRGKNSIRREGNEPLYIIDGVPQSSETPSLYSATILPWSSINPLNAINPNDIESFEVLKDVDATAIYGSRGANGVVIVTTKKGKKGRTELKFNTSYSLSSAANRMKMLSTEQYIDMRNQAFQNDNITVIPAVNYDINGTWDRSTYTDWQKELIGNTAASSVVQLSLSGGSENMSYLISYNHNEQSTVFPADFRYKTNNFSGNLSYQTPDKRLELTLTNSISFQNNNVQNEDLTRRSLTLSPNAPALYTADGNINWENSTFNNPIASLKSEYLNRTAYFNNGLNISYKLFPFLALKMNGGLSYQNFEERALKPSTMYNPSSGLTSANSISSKNNQTNFSYILEPQIVGSYQMKDHQFEVLLGTTLQQTVSDQGSIQGAGFESNALIENIGAAKTKVISDQVKTQYYYTAAFARFNYQFRKRYILNLTGRRDGSSRFGADNRFGNFGAVGAAWIFSEERVLKESPWLSLGKIRGSIGTTGNDKIGDYQYLNTYIISSNIYNGITGLNPARLFNPYFSWEKTLKKEIALEVGLFKNRVSLTGAYYENTSSNQLVGIPLPATTGFASIQSNLPARIQNKGWEFDASVQVFRSGDFKYSSSVNLSIPKNKLVEFPNLEGSTYANQYMIGFPVSIVKLYQFEGIDPQTGLFKFTDFNGDGKITSPDDNKAVEKVGVEFHGGWNNNFRYKQWSASFLWHFVKQRNFNYNRQISMPGTMNNQPLEVLDSWSPSNPDAAYMSYSAGSNAQKNTLHGFFQNSTAAISDASFIRLKNVQLNYSIPVQKFGIREAMIYVQGQNLLTITNYFGLDPEFNLVGYLPPLKTYSFGFQLSF